MHLTFLGGTGTVTGSRFLLEAAGHQILIECGLFQGLKELRLRNWDDFPIPSRDIDAILLTHAHLDHSGYLPVLTRQGYNGPVYGTPPTVDLCRILLPDSGYLLEEEASYANARGFSKHHPALPLYTERDAIRALDQLRAIPFGETHELLPGVHLRFSRVGHMLGAACLLLEAEGKRLLFSGDLGRPEDLLLRPPEPPPETDVLLIESTYGDRLHLKEDPLEEIEAVVVRTIARGGTVVIPAFAVGRAQVLLYALARLREEQRIPSVPIYLNSPMAIEASKVFHRYTPELRISPTECEAMEQIATCVRDVEASIALNRSREPKIIISASGMATGGRVLHHLKAFGPDPRNTLLFTGYQAAGTRGATVVSGAEVVKIHGELVPIRAEVVNLMNLSGHADYEETLDWMSQLPHRPVQTFVIHGEPAGAAALQTRIEERLGWTCTLPSYLERREVG